MSKVAIIVIIIEPMLKLQKDKTRNLGIKSKNREKNIRKFRDNNVTQ